MSTNNIFVYNEKFQMNYYKNIIIDLFFLDTSNLAYKSVPLDVLLSDVSDKDQIDLYSKDLKELHKMGYGFEYFGNKSMSLMFILYFKAFYKNITLYCYKNEQDAEEYLPLSKMLYTYSKNKLTEYSESTRYSTFSSNKIKNYSSLITK